MMQGTEAPLELTRLQRHCEIGGALKLKCCGPPKRSCADCTPVATTDISSKLRFAIERSLACATILTKEMVSQRPAGRPYEARRMRYDR